MANFTNKTVKSITDQKVVVPFSNSISGTISTEGVMVIGDSNTDFFAEMQNGSYLVDLSQNEFRRVEDVISKNSARLSHPFTSDIAPSTTPEVISAGSASPREISVRAIDEIILVTNEEATIPAGLSITDTRINGYGVDKNYIVNPCIVDATGASAIIEVLY